MPETEMVTRRIEITEELDEQVLERAVDLGCAWEEALELLVQYGLEALDECAVGDET